MNRGCELLISRLRLPQAQQRIGAVEARSSGQNRENLVRVTFSSLTRQGVAFSADGRGRPQGPSSRIGQMPTSGIGPCESGLTSSPGRGDLVRSGKSKPRRIFDLLRCATVRIGSIHSAEDRHPWIRLAQGSSYRRSDYRVRCIVSS